MLMNGFVLSIQWSGSVSSLQGISPEFLSNPN